MHNEKLFSVRFEGDSEQAIAIRASGQMQAKFARESPSSCLLNMKESESCLHLVGGRCFTHMGVDQYFWSPNEHG